VGTLDGKVAFISGGARGQGRSHAVALAREGCDVALFDIAAPMDVIPYDLASAEELAETALLVEKEGRRALALQGDVRSTQEVDSAVQRTVDEFGGLDIVIANAGVIQYTTVENCDDEAWETVLATNLTGEFKVVRAAIPHLRARGGGQIITVSSMAGRVAYPNLPHYVAAKWGVIGLTKAVAQELAGTGITANTICPSSVATTLFLNQAAADLFFPDKPDASVADLEQLPPTGGTRIATLECEHVTRAIMYLVGDPGVLTGQVIEIGNGMSARLT
jgi:NAD(P)-dependent dehydrogenase (short-subunit alcohol dehydrogenase family)